MENKVDKTKPSMHLVVTDYLDLIKAKATPISLENLTNEPLIIVEFQYLADHAKNIGISEAISESIFSMGQTLAKITVKDNCWKYKKSVNQFYHNVLFCLPLPRFQSVCT